MNLKTKLAPLYDRIIVRKETKKDSLIVRPDNAPIFQGEDIVAEVVAVGQGTPAGATFRPPVVKVGDRVLVDGELRSNELMVTTGLLGEDEFFCNERDIAAIVTEFYDDDPGPQVN